MLAVFVFIWHVFWKALFPLSPRPSLPFKKSGVLFYLPLVSGTEPISKTFFITYVYNFYSCSALFRKSKEPSNSQYCEQTCNFYCHTLDKTAYINEKISY